MLITVDYPLLALDPENEKSLENKIQNLLAKSEGREVLHVNALFLVEGFEYRRMKERVLAFDGKFDSIEFSPSILGTSERINDFAKFIIKNYRIRKTENCLFVGHGNKDSENVPYKNLQEAFCSLGYGKTKVAVLNGQGNAEDYLNLVKEEGISGKVKVFPLFINKGNHLVKDMSLFCKKLSESGLLVKYKEMPLSDNKNFRKIYATEENMAANSKNETPNLDVDFKVNLYDILAFGIFILFAWGVSLFLK